MLRRVAVVDNIAKGVCGAIIVIISTFVVIIEGLSTLDVARRNTNNYNSNSFNKTIAIIRF